MRPLSALLLLSCLPIAATEWRPVDPAELAAKTPRVDPAAEAEAIFWDIRIEDRVLGGQDVSLALNHYIRIKIFKELGKEKYATVEIPQYSRQTIQDVAGRTIKPDGTIIPLKKDAIFDRELVKIKGAKLHGKTFTLPNVEVGDIIEYQYKEVRDNEIVSYMRLYFQRDLPIWNVTYHLKPLNLPYLPFAMRSMAFQCQHPPFQKEGSTGFFSTTMTNMPAFHEEPYMPPEDQLRAWVLIYYEEDKKLDAEKYWKDVGKHDYATMKPLTSADGLVKRTAAELVSGIDKPEDKLAALDSFCRNKIKNLSSSRATAAERKAAKENHSPGDTLKQKAGWGNDIDLLFTAMANAAGFEARMARVPNRGDTFFSPKTPTTYFLSAFSVAVKVGDQWMFFDPSTSYLEHGMIRWQEEGQPALISDPKEGFFAKTQFLEPERSVRKRRANLKLKDDGSIEGSVEYSYTGHVSRSEKLDVEDQTAAQREEDWKKSLQGRLSTAEMSDFEIANVDDHEKPMVVKYKVAVSGYATRTGKRILLQPAFFQHNVGPRFTATDRKWPVYFDYGWAEDDEVTIELPAGWELDLPTAPQSSTLGGVGAYSVNVRKTLDGKTVIYKRNFDWGRHMNILIPASEYSHINQVFDFVQEQDGYTIALRAAGDAK